MGTPVSRQEALQMLDRITARKGHEFWIADLSLADVAKVAAFEVRDHVTDAYLATLAHAKGGKVATFDKRLKNRTLADVVELIPAT
jgi:hypothetical protein